MGMFTSSKSANMMQLSQAVICCKVHIYCHDAVCDYITAFCLCVCVCGRWEEEYTARMDLQEKVAELEEVK